ncbi:unnamed protein product, partial [Ectocarpus sp. 8 AP-2014]
SHRNKRQTTTTEEYVGNSHAGRRTASCNFSSGAKTKPYSDLSSPRTSLSRVPVTHQHRLDRKPFISQPTLPGRGHQPAAKNGAPPPAQYNHHLHQETHTEEDSPQERCHFHLVHHTRQFKMLRNTLPLNH